MNPLLSNSQPGKAPTASELRAMAESDPQIRALLAMHSGNAKEAFYALCRQRRVNPDSILNRLR